MISTVELRKALPSEKAQFLKNQGYRYINFHPSPTVDHQTAPLPIGKYVVVSEPFLEGDLILTENLVFDSPWVNPLCDIDTVINTKRRTKNPPFQGYDPNYPYRKKPKNDQKLKYRRKRDALNVFIDHNLDIIDEAFSGPTAKQPYDSFDNLNHKYGLKGDRRVNTLAKALWLVMPAGAPYYLEDIDVEALNETSPMRHNTHRALTLPDHVEEARLIAEQEEYYRDHYEDQPQEEEPLQHTAGMYQDEIPF